jgi:hypothetical protein
VTGVFTNVLDMCFGACNIVDSNVNPRFKGVPGFDLQVLNGGVK